MKKLIVVTALAAVAGTAFAQSDEQSQDQQPQTLAQNDQRPTMHASVANTPSGAAAQNVDCKTSIPGHFCDTFFGKK